MTIKRLLLVLVLALTLTGLGAGPALAQAQARVAVSHPVVIVGGGFGYPGYGFGFYGQYPWGWYGPYGGYGWGGWGWGGWGGYGWGYPYYDYYLAGARIEALPKEAKTAEVYVDGVQAGLIDDFDGWWQTLNLSPGEHELAIFLEGFKTERRRLYFSAGTTAHIKLTMEKLPAGQSSGPRPQPEPQAAPAAPADQPQPRARQYAQAQVQEPPAEPATRYGTLSIRVIPPDAEIRVDNESWKSIGGEQRLAVKLSAGRHHVQVIKDGYETYGEDILIRPEATMTLNVSLSRK